MARWLIMADLDALKVRELQAWLAYKDPTGWSEHKKLKAKQQLRDAAVAVYSRIA